MKLEPFRILVATDLHLGYGERDAILSEDSIETFEEILNFAKYEDVDFILLGGDLFHENKPSRKIMCQTINLLRKYCIGKRSPTFTILSNSESAKTKFNFQDSDINVAIPVFSIHGNHDDPIGVDGLCSLDLLSSAGLVNYFGKSETAESVTIRPLLFNKNDTTLAIYGIGALKDKTLNNLFQKNLVKTIQPENSDELFNILVLHQNRASHSKYEYIPESYLMDFLDLVIWGHEHKCIIDPVDSPGKNFKIIQPGSSIATSLSLSETFQKHVAILEVEGKSFKINKIPLQTVRPILYKTVNLDETTSFSQNSNDLMKWASSEVESLLHKYKPKSCATPALPLVRLKIQHVTDIPVFNNKQFGKAFASKLANPNKIVLLKKIDIKAKDIERNSRSVTLNDKTKIVNLINEYFENKQESVLKVFPVNDVSESVQNFVQKADKDSISSYFDNYLEGLLSNLYAEKAYTDEKIEAAIENFKKLNVVPAKRPQTTCLDDKENLDILSNSMLKVQQNPVIPKIVKKRKAPDSTKNSKSKKKV